ncbi:MAG: hypothetical protein INR71_01030 [Terriglobus roseus]|nr:hypothetical protein [Terriglobus roseus]
MVSVAKARTFLMTSRTSNLLDKFGISLVAGALLLSAPALASASRGAAADRTDGSVATTATISPDTLHHWADAGATGEDPATLHHWPHRASTLASIDPDTLHHWP